VESIATSILHLHGLAALALIFALPALESSIFLGFIFPGETAAVLGGVLAYEHRISLFAAFAAVILGAVIGDTVGYEVGHRWGNQLLEGPLARLIKPAHVERARRYVQRHGGKAVFFGRFTAALRVLIPGIAGTARVPYRRFVLFNVAGGFLWAVGFVLLGYLAGASWRSVARTASTAGLVALVVVVAGVIAAIAVRRHRQSSREETSEPD